MQWYLLDGTNLLCTIYERYTDEDVDSFHQKARVKLEQMDRDRERHGDTETITGSHSTRTAMNQWLQLKKGHAVLVFTYNITDNELSWQRNLIVNDDDLTEVESPRSCR